MKTLLFTCAAIITAVTFAHAAETDGKNDGAKQGGFYVSARIGMNLLDDLDANLTENYTEKTIHEEHSYKNGPLFSGAAGWKTRFFRAEGEIEYTTNAWDQYRISIDGGEFLTLGPSGSWNALSVFGNMYIDFDNRTKYTPYIFGGIGVTQLGWDNITFSYNGVAHSVRDQSDLVFSWKLGTGLAWNLRENISLDLAYLYMKTNNVEIKDAKGGYDYTSHALSLGGRYQF